MEQKKIIPGIRCDVTNCVYNDKRANCYANQIEVGPQQAQSKDETICGTFRNGDDGQRSAH